VRDHHLERLDHVAASLQDDAREVASGFECGIGSPTTRTSSPATSSKPSKSARFQNGLTHGPSIRKTPSLPRSARVNQILREVISDELTRISDIDDRIAS